MSTGQRKSVRALMPSSNDGETPATARGAVRYVPLSVPVILLPAGSTAADVAALDVPSGTIPVGTIVLVKA